MDTHPPVIIHIEDRQLRQPELVVVDGHFVLKLKRSELDKEHRRGPHHDMKHDPDQDGDRDEPNSLFPPYPTSADPEGMADQTK